MHVIHGRVLPNFSFSFPNSSWHSAMNGMQTNKMCAVHGRVLPNFFLFFFFESIYTNPKLLAFIQETCWHLYKKKTCWHLYKRVSLDSVSLGGLHLYKPKTNGIYTRNLLAFIQEKTCWHLYKRVSSDSVSLGGGCIYTN